MEQKPTLFAVATDNAKVEAVESVMRMLAGDIIREVYRPRRTLLCRYRGSWVPRTEDIFRGYVFVETVETESAYLFDKLKQVGRWCDSFATLMHNQQGLPPEGRRDSMVFIFPTPEEAAIIRNLCDGTHTLTLSKVVIDEENPFRPGEKIRILEGPMKTLESNITRVDLHRRRAYLSAPLFGEGELMVSFELTGTDADPAL